MRYLVLCGLLVGCTKSVDQATLEAKDREIARLLAEAGKAKGPAPNSQPETVAPGVRGESNPPPRPGDIADAEASLIDNVLAGTLTETQFTEVVKRANANKSITYAHLKKNADRYKGQPWRLSGRIVEIAEVGGKTRGRISLSDYGDSVLFFEHPGETDFVQNNTAEMVGVLAGNYSYKSQAGWNITIPAFFASAITKRGGIDKRAGIRPAAQKSNIKYGLQWEGEPPP